jgi:phasin family protein
MGFVRCSNRRRTGQIGGTGFEAGRVNVPVLPKANGSMDPPLKGQAMYNATEQFTEFNQANVSNAIKLASFSIENAEKLVSLNINAAKLAIAQAVEGAQAAASVKDVQELLSLRAKLAEVGVQSATGYSRTLYELSTEAQAGFSALAEETWNAYTKGVASWVEKASQSAPAGSDVAVNALKSTFAASTAAFDQFQKATKQVVDFADASVRAATASATKAAANAANVSKTKRA